MMAVNDEAAHEIAIQCRTDHTGRSAFKLGHGIEQMGHAGQTFIDSALHFVIGCKRMTRRHGYAALHQRRDGSGRGQLGREGDKRLAIF